MAVDEGSYVGLRMNTASKTGSSTSTPIDSSNIGFQLLKKQGWKEGTGLGASEQGRLEPIQTFVKKNKRGLGAKNERRQLDNQKLVRRRIQSYIYHMRKDYGKLQKKKGNGLMKKMKKIQEFENQLQEKEFDRAFFRMFWPDNF